MHLYLIRHGESFVNIAPQPAKQQGFDTGLTELGRKQASAVAKWMARKVPQINALYCSTLKRAVETAKFLADAYQCDILFDDRLCEIGSNRMDHSRLPEDAIPNQYCPWSPYQFPFSPVSSIVDNIESLMHYHVRVGMFLEDMMKKHKEETVVVVGHGGTVRVVCNIVFNVGPYARCYVNTGHTGVCYLRFMGHSDRETWQLYYLGRTEHLIEFG
jgi:broad specificity phosphatase PhoE